MKEYIEKREGVTVCRIAAVGSTTQPHQAVVVHCVHLSFILCEEEEESQSLYR